MISVTAQIGNDHYKTQVSNNRGHMALADEPADLDGSDLGMAPDEWLAGALATCSIITMRMYADRKGWPLERIELEVAFERDSNASHFIKKVKFTGILSPEQQERLLMIGDKCPVHKTLSNPIAISSVIV